MKKIIALLMVAVMGLSLVACGQTDADTNNAESTEATELNYEEVVPDELQGVWGDTGTKGLLSLYAFKGKKVKTYVVKFGTSGTSALSGTYDVKKSKIKYDFGNSSGYSNYTYDNNVLTMMNANGDKIKKLSDADIMKYLKEEEKSSNKNGVICLANLIIDYYPDSANYKMAVKKKNSIISEIKSKGKAALQKLNATYDEFQDVTWYEHVNKPQYVDISCYIYPYIGLMDDGTATLRVVLNYTDAKTNGGWLFFNNVIFNVDGKKTSRSFSSDEITRDNDTEVWEVADFEPTDSEIKLLESIANSTKTVIRFEGNQYYDEFVVTDTEKAAIKDVLAAYEYLKDYA